MPLRRRRGLFGAGAWGGGAGSGLPPPVAGAGEAGAEVAGAVLTPGDGLAGLSPELNPIATAVPTSSTATVGADDDHRRQAIPRNDWGLGLWPARASSRSKFSCGRADVNPDPAATGMERAYSPVADGQ